MVDNLGDKPTTNLDRFESIVQNLTKCKLVSKNSSRYNFIIICLVLISSINSLMLNLYTYRNFTKTERKSGKFEK